MSSTNLTNSVRGERFALMLAVLVLGVGCAFRLVALETVPGINGDEAWYGVQVGRMVSGQPFDWKTPSRLPLNPFYVALQAPCLALFGPQVWGLRAPAVIAGILTPLLAWRLLAGPLGVPAARITMLLLAAHPMMIGYSRFGWDSSLTPLAGIVALSLAVRLRWLSTLLAWVVSLIVHPSNLLLVPVLVAPFVAEGLRRVDERDGVRPPDGLRFGRGWGLGLLVLLVCWEAAVFLVQVPPSLWEWAPTRFAGRCADLLSGLTTFRYLAGEPPALVVRLHGLVFWALVPPVLAGGGVILAAKRDWFRLALILGPLTSALILFALSGPDVIQPGTDRYGAFLLVPTAVALAVALVGLADPILGPSGARIGLGVIVPILAALWLMDVHAWYWKPLAEQGGSAHRTFRTGDKDEPKRAAYRLIFNDGRRSPSTGKVRILAEDWWTAWPLRYMALVHPDVEVLSLEETEPFKRGSDAPPLKEELAEIVRTAAREDYVVGFPGGAAEAALRGPDGSARLPAATILDPQGRPVLLIFRPGP